jgi:DNA-binding transcriptional LysR family regulator
LAAFETPDGPVTGHLVLDCFEDLAPFCAPAIIARVQRQHPGIEVAVHEFDLETVGKRLKSGASDLAITYELGVPKGLVTEMLQRVTPHALLAADDPLARRKRLDLRTLCKVPLVFTREFLSLQHFFELLRSHGATPIKTLEAGSFEMQRSMVANGLGRAIAYTQSCSDVTYDGKRVVRRALRERLAPHPILLAYAPELRGSRAIDALAQEARSYFRELPSSG